MKIFKIESFHFFLGGFFFVHKVLWKYGIYTVYTISSSHFVTGQGGEIYALFYFVDENRI